MPSVSRKRKRETKKKKGKKILREKNCHVLGEKIQDVPLRPRRQSLVSGKTTPSQGSPGRRPIPTHQKTIIERKGLQKRTRPGEEPPKVRVMRT